MACLALKSNRIVHMLITSRLRHGHGMGWNLVLVVLGTFSFWSDFLSQKDLKAGKKWLSYVQINNGRLRDSSEYHTGCMGSMRASFEPKRSKNGQETAELWPIYQREVA